MTVQELTPSACWSLLRGAQVGRLAACVGRRPEIFPVNYVVDGGSIVFRTGDGSKLRAITTAPDIAFEVDGYDADAGDAWSVVAHGRAADLPDSEIAEALALPLFPWHGGPKHRLIRIEPYLISGRRFIIAPSPGAAVPGTTGRPAPIE
ncbi:pyridoxamine 5'-phosphate oxidase family protein [Jatrophihabitans sp.]|uniref:pyridoxamine 5'-phosphate oxidase family protein n=1 Tax=Jatrophihabitans sp. TaxID=1932789 RepID=UPI0030C68C2A|nr:flavin-nucleotide-binding protein [Jatrophihabitans sp.]